MSETSKKLKDRLERNIWITRKCRINAAERLLKSARFIEFLNTYYSIFIITISIISFAEHDNALSVISLILSVALTISIIYANSTNLRERSYALKQNYIDLQILLDELNCIDESCCEKITQIAQRYSELLKNSENHESIDMYKLLFFFFLQTINIMSSGSHKSKSLISSSPAKALDL